MNLKHRPRGKKLAHSTPHYSYSLAYTLRRA